MWRVIVGPILGYIAMVAVVIGCIAATWFSLGPGFAFDNESFSASLGWTITMLVSGFLAAIVGGVVAKLVGGSEYGEKAVLALAGLILVLGIVTIVAQSMSPPVEVPEGLKTSDVSFAEAGQYAKSPTWYNYAIIVVGMAGAIIGGKLLSKNSSSADQG